MKRVVSEVDINKNVNWLGHPAVWFIYLSVIVVSWLGISVLIDDAGLAW